MDQKIITVLLIEDDEVDIKLIKHCFAEEIDRPFALEVATTLKAASDRIVQGNINAILTDLSLPDSDGLATVEALAAQAPNVPIVVLTTRDEKEFELNIVRKGAQDYMMKNEVTRPYLIRTLLHAIERHRLVKENEEMTNQFEQLTLIDPLTELLNRRGLQKALSRETAWVRRNGTGLSALLIDVDNFKQINDRFGYAAGNIILKNLSAKLAQSLRATDYIARIGGDEFVVLLPQTRMADSLTIAEKIRLAISETRLSAEAQEVRLTISLGLIQATDAIVSVDELLQEAHHSLSQSKREGKNRVSFEQGGIYKNHDLIDQVLDKLKKSETYHVVKQPIFRLKDMRTYGYEFLSRSKSDVFQMPEDFFRVCRANNILTLVDHFCLRNCIEAGKQVAPETIKHINLYPSTLIEIPIEHLINEFPKDSSRNQYCIELSEELITGDPSSLVGIVKELKKAGLKIAIDDVGFGRSCLEGLVLLEPDIVKIDKIINIGISKEMGRVRSLKRLLAIINSLEAQAVAEGIETQEDLDVLLSLGIEYGQGFLWGKPA